MPVGVAMLACTETITLVQQEEGVESDTYRCTVIDGVSWYDRAKAVLQEHGLTAMRETKIRIPESVLPPGVFPQEGNFIVRGEVSEITQITGLADYVSIRVMAVGDNRRGRLPHVLVIGQ